MKGFSHRLLHIFLFLLLLPFTVELPALQLGIDRIFEEEWRPLLKGKRLAIVVNLSSVDSELQPSYKKLQQHAIQGDYRVAALFVPEHGLRGDHRAGEKVDHDHLEDGTPVYSLHGAQRRPTAEQLRNIDLILYDLQDIGSRSYTYISTLFYLMEEATKVGKPIVVLDRPNPINGIVVDGPLLDIESRSFLSYIDVPYCHGMTVGELAGFFNQEYKVGCTLTIIPMKDWKREESYKDTGLIWLPSSPNIPEATTPLYYPITGLLGELSLVNIGIGTGLPFRIVVAPWINADHFCTHLNELQLPGVLFTPYHCRPTSGKFANSWCHGTLITVCNAKLFKPVATAFSLIGCLKRLYRTEVMQVVEQIPPGSLFARACGTEAILKIIREESLPIWKLRELHEARRKEFLAKRKRLLLYP